MTYAALAQTGSGVGKGGFDVDSIEMFLQLANVQFVALDEVHKVVEDMKSVSADVTRQLTAWLRDGSMRGLIGFSGTAEAYRPRFAELGLRLAHAIPLDTLIGYGFVAPFAELGVPFANSARERRIRELLDIYKSDLAAYTRLLGGERLRGWFAELPLDERVEIARSYLGMYRGRADAADGHRQTACATGSAAARSAWPTRRWSRSSRSHAAGRTRTWPRRQASSRTVRDGSGGAGRRSRRAGEADLSAQHRRPACESTGLATRFDVDELQTHVGRGAFGRCPRRERRELAEHHHRRPVQHAQRLVHARRRGSRRDDQGGHRCRARGPARQRRHRVRRGQAHSLAAGAHRAWLRGRGGPVRPASGRQALQRVRGAVERDVPDSRRGRSAAPAHRHASSRPS